MAGPITWQNITGDTGVRDASNALSNASQSFNAGLRDITQAIQGQRDTQLANLQQQNKSNRTLLEDAINRYGTAAELQSAQDSGAIQSLIDSLGPNVNRTGLSDLITNRIDTLTGREDAQAKRAGADVADQITGLLADGQFDAATQLRQDNMDVLDRANLLGTTSQQFKESLLASQKVTGSKVQDEFNSRVLAGDFEGAQKYRDANQKAFADAGLLDDSQRFLQEQQRAQVLLGRQDDAYNQQQAELKAGREADALVRGNLQRTLEAQQVTEDDNRKFAEAYNVPYTEDANGAVSLDLSKLDVDRQKEVRAAYNRLVADKAQGAATATQRQTIQDLVSIKNLRGGDLSNGIATINQLSEEYRAPAAEDVQAVQLQQEANRRALLNNNVFATSADPNYNVAGDLADITKAMKANDNISVPNAAGKVRELMTTGVSLPVNGKVVNVPVPKAIMEDIINTAGSTGITGLGNLGWLDSNDGLDLEAAVRDLMLSPKYVQDFERLQQYRDNDAILRSQLTDSYNGSDAASRVAASLQSQVTAGENALRDALQKSLTEKQAKAAQEKAAQEAAERAKIVTRGQSGRPKRTSTSQSTFDINDYFTRGQQRSR